MSRRFLRTMLLSEAELGLVPSVPEESGQEGGLAVTGMVQGFTVGGETLARWEFAARRRLRRANRKWLGMGIKDINLPGHHRRMFL